MKALSLICFLLPPCSLLSDEWHDQLMREATIGAARQKLIGTGEQLDQRDLFTPLDQLYERIDGEHIIQIDGQLVVGICQGNPARQAPVRAPTLYGAEAGVAAALPQPLRLVLVHHPSRAGK